VAIASDELALRYPYKNLERIVNFLASFGLIVAVSEGLLIAKQYLGLFLSAGVLVVIA
jgi:hypothetical protein